MPLFKRTSKLKRAYDEKLMKLIREQKRQFDSYEKVEPVVVDEQPEWRAQYKLQKAKYYYLFKEARIRRLNGDILD
ncbi:MAG: YaaL family protein [Alkalibacterium sp.]|uniref:YaaL family protein n=1 Tax=Alkalibacterium sp. TaxID=1872447 RepID=UPI003970CF5C